MSLLPAPTVRTHSPAATLRVLHVIPGIAPRYGGPSAAILPMCAALARLPGFRVEIATTDADGAGRHLAPEALSDCPVRLHLFRRDFSERWKYSAGLRAWLTRHVADYDVIHVHGAWNFPTAAACRAARTHGVPVVYRPCGMLSAYTWSRRPFFKHVYWQLLERANVTSAAAFHCTSEAEAEEVRGHRAARGAIHVIPLGIDPAAWDVPASPGLLSERCGVQAAGKPIVLFLSRLHGKKGITDRLLPAFARLRADAFLAVVGGGDDHDPGHPEKVRAEVHRLGLGDRVALLGPVAPQERWAMFDGADLFVLPSHSENFGIVVIEAMARGCPVVTTPGTATHAFVTESGCGRVSPGDPAALAGVMDDLLADPAGRAAMRERGRAFVRARLDWSAVAQQIRSMYEGCVSRGGVDRRRVRVAHSEI